MSVIGNEFSGLPIADLIGGPLKAACDAQVRLATATANFINTIGFNREKQTDGTYKFSPRQVDFSFWQPLPMKKEVPATGTITLSGVAIGTCTSIKIGSTECLSSSISNVSGETLEVLAKKIADGINAHSALSTTNADDKYTASSSGVIVIIQAPQGNGASFNGKTIVFAATGFTMPAGITMAGGVDGDTEAKVQKVVLSIPFLAIVNTPSLMIKNVDITFDMEVKSSESHKDDLSEEVSCDVGIKIDFGIISADVKIHAAVSSHQENTRSTDRSAKYHVAVSARDDGMPEGLSRVFDILQKSIVPVSAGNPMTLQDAKIAQTTK
jgi:hypothetical protein